MSGQERQAGPGPDRERRKGQEAVGPGGPRLIMEEVSFHLGPRGAEARVSLALGRQRFVGSSSGRGQANWQLAAAAAVEATQHYLQQCPVPAPAPYVRLLATALDSTRFGQEIIHVTVSFTDGEHSSCLLGSALVRNDRCSTAVAAALDATSRRLSRYRLPASSPQVPVPILDFARAEPEPMAPASDVLSAFPAGREPEAVPPPDLAAVRPPVPTRPAAYALGLGITLNSVAAAAVDAEGRPAAQVQRAARSGDPEAAMRALLEAAQEAVAQLNSHAERLGAVGLAAPGRLQPREGLCVSCRDLPRWKEVQLARPVGEELQLPVELLGVAQAAALAEARFGAARGLSDLLFVRVGAAIEAAVLIDGQLLTPTRADGGELGHLVIESEGPVCTCGATGCWAALAGQEALVSRVADAMAEGARTTLGAARDRRRTAITPAAICKAASQGDPVARMAVEQTGRYLALGLGNLITVFNPEAVILDSAPSAVGASLRRAVENALKGSPRAAAFSRCVLLSPELGELATALGAAVWAQEVGSRE